MGKQPLQRLFHKGPPGGTTVQQLYTQLLGTPKPEDAAQGSGLLFTETLNDLEVYCQPCPWPASSCSPDVQSCSANKELSQLLSSY